MFETPLNLLYWSWNHLEIAGLILSGVALLFIVWLHVPKELTYYWQHGQIMIHPFNVRNEIPASVRGRIAVLRFSWEHGIRLAFGKSIGLSLLEFFLKLLWIPDPRHFAWEHWFGAMLMYPLGRSRREYVTLCMTQQMWPWKRTKTLQRILDENQGRLPKLGQSTFLAALINRLHAHF